MITFDWILAAGGGLALGLVFYGGLWATVIRMTLTSRPTLLFSVSFLGRLLLAVTGFILLSGRDAGRILACLAGFLLMRVLVTRCVSGYRGKGRQRSAG